METDARVLDTQHVPQHEDILVARSDELTALTQPVRDFLSGFPDTHVLITGPTGTGKTLLSKFVIERVWKEDPAVETAYVDCWEHHSTHALYRELLRPLGEHVTLDERGVSKIQLRERFRQAVDDPYVVVLDELVQLDDLREFFTLYGMENVFVIGACNDSDDLLARMDAAEQSRFRGGRHIELNRYADAELCEILRKRVQYGLDPAAVPDAVIERIAAGAGGDARVAIESLYKAVREAGRQNESVLSVESVPAAIDDAEVTIRQRSLSKLKRRQRRLLTLLSEFGGWAAMSDIEDAFIERYEPVSRETIRKHLRALIHYNHVEEKGKKRWKRYRAVTEVDASRSVV
ncbi:Cdc6/Cdc18 family protein [Halorarius litoreus]|uniref:Cdc6/Cdc18 family protein n=1 Tax=Halorarius litoreus TaxID=2962676 RepID=UPI0020CF99A4|nr:Cdc6/Cdc18 family protein [Halorarius litoreus]